jgi:hypothetical protein
MDIAAVFSVEKERVAVTCMTNPKTAGGNVEKWLVEVEKMMKEVGCSRFPCFFHLFCESLTNFASSGKVSWAGRPHRYVQIF